MKKTSPVMTVRDGHARCMSGFTIPHFHALTCFFPELSFSFLLCSSYFFVWTRIPPHPAHIVQTTDKRRKQKTFLFMFSALENIRLFLVRCKGVRFKLAIRIMIFETMKCFVHSADLEYKRVFYTI